MNKLLLALLLLVAATRAQAAIYYVSASGNNASNGTSTSTPWQTLSKVNATTLSPGDQVLFNRGDTFYGSLTITNSGTSGSPILIGAYGTGANPVLTGFTSVTQWSDLGANIWESTQAVSTLSTCMMVSVNGQSVAMGRHPNATASNGGYLIIDAASGNTSLTSDELTGTPNWTGAGLVIRTSRWTVDKTTISSQSGGTLNYSHSGYAAGAEYGFFMQNDPRTLDSQGEWYYNPSTKKLRIYSTSTPQNVQVASVEDVLSIGGDYITVDGIQVTGANSIGITSPSSSLDHVNILNSAISFSGNTAINLECEYLTVENCTIRYSNNRGADLAHGGNITFRGNLVENTGTMVGMIGDGNGSSVGCTFYSTHDVLIEYNRVIDTGYKGIDFYGTNITVKNNYVDHFCYVLDDGGGIYTYTASGADHMTNCRIQGNVVLNGLGAATGTSSGIAQSDGIYLDNNTDNVEVFDNTVAFCNRWGIYLHDTQDIYIHNNTCFDNGVIYSGGGQLHILNDTGSEIVFNNDVISNLFIAPNDNRTVFYRSTALSTINPGSTLDLNYYIQTVSPTLPIAIGSTSVPSGKYSLAYWQNLSGQDLNSSLSPYPVTGAADFRFEYNDTKVSKTVALSKPMVDFKGVKYASSVTLSPFTSVVMIEDPNPAPGTDPEDPPLPKKRYLIQMEGQYLKHEGKTIVTK